MELNVLSVTGRAWVVLATGEERELSVGDVLEPGQRVVTADGSQVILSGADGRVYTLDSGQNVRVESISSRETDSNPDPADDESAPGTLSDADQAQTEPVDDDDNAIVSHGHRFVELKPIDETIESDGITPLTIAPIEETLRPLDMRFPERDNERDEYRETRGGESRWAENTRDLPPEALDDENSTGQGDILVVGTADGVLTNDNDPDGTTGSLRVSAVDGSGGNLGRPVPGDNGGTFILREDGSYEFDPGDEFDSLAAGQTTTTKVTYTVEDEQGGSDQATVTITVIGSNDAPTAVNTIPDQNAVDASPVTSLDVGNYFDDPDTGDKLAFSATNLPPGLTIDPGTGLISGTPDRSASQGGDNGIYSVTVTADDGSGGTVDQTFDWNITNPAPTAVDDTGTTDEDTVLTVSSDGILTNDSDPDGDPLTVTQINGKSGELGAPVAGDNGGQFTLNSDGSYTFDPNDEFDDLPDGDSKETSITYTIDDGEGGTDTATLTVTVTRVDDQVTIDVPVDHPDTPVVDETDDQVVFEKSLDDGSEPNADGLKVIDSLTVTAGDGLRSNDAATLRFSGQDGNADSLDLDRSTLESLGTDSVTIATQYGDLVLNGYSESDGTITLDYEYTLTRAPGVDADDVMDTVTVTAFDRDGDNASADLDIKIIDDAPIARADENTVTEDSGTPAEGNVIGGTGASVGDQADTEGADGAILTGIESTNIPANDATSDSGQLTIEGEYGTLTIESDGTYLYDLDNSNATVNALKDGQTLEDVFRYTLTDGDSDTSDANLTITINGVSDGIPTIVPKDDNAGADGQQTVYESGLTDSSGDQQATGAIDVTAPDGLDWIEIDGTRLVGSDLDALASTPVAIDTGEGTLVLDGWDESSGELSYTYTLTAAQDQPGAGDSIDSIALQLRDQGGGTATGTLEVHIVDDVPTITAGSGDPSLTVDETSLGTTDSAGFDDLFDVDYGADNAAASHSLVYALAIGNGGDAGLVDTATGQDINLEDAGDGVIEGRNADGDLAFTVTLDAASGEITLGQSRAVRHHVDSDPDDAVSLTNEALSLVLTATDGDGDNAEESIAIGDRLVFRDDGPSITVGNDGDFAPDTLATADANTVAGDDSDSTTYAGAFAITAQDGGADGTDAVSWEYALGLTDPTSGLSSAGEPIVLAVESGAVVGRADGDEVFRLSVAADGTVTLTQSGPIDHPSADPNETIDLPAGLVELTGTATITDGDGDTATSSETVSLGTVQFADDGPSIGSPEPATADEANLPAGSDPDATALTRSGSLDLATGADADTTRFDTTLSADQSALDALNLTSGGQAVTWSLDAAGHELTATAGSETVFTLRLTDPGRATAGYEFELLAALDGDGGADIDLPFAFVATDADGDTASDTLTVTVLDDTPGDRSIEVDEDDSVTVTTSADATDLNTAIGTGSDAPAHGTASVDAQGQITYVPDADYSGSDRFTYTTTADDGSAVTRTVTVTVNPVADAPTLSHATNETSDVDAVVVATREDEAVTLGLRTPIIVDDSDQNGSAPGDAPERLGPIVLDGFPDGAVLQKADGTEITLDNGSVSVYLSDQPNLHIEGIDTQSGLVALTAAEYEALEVIPPTHDATNFDLGVSAESLEVDDAGQPLSGVPGAKSTQVVTVAVEAVTDDASLIFDTSVDASGVTDLEDLTFSGDTEATATLAEDTAFNLNALLEASFADLDGSEVRSLTITNTTGEAIVVDGTTVANGSDVTIDALANDAGQTGGIDSFPAIRIGGAPDFSGDLDGIEVTINAQDRDDDGFEGNLNPGTPVDGVAEADTTNNSVTLNLRVLPRAGDVAADGVETDEDTAVAFLQHLRVTDDGSDSGTEVIDAVSFDVPDDWTIAESTVSNGASWSTSQSGSTYTITFTGGTEADREAVLDGFTLTPPAHSSVDQDIELTVTSTDTQTVGGNAEAHTTDTTLSVPVTVRPVGERVDVDSDGSNGNDLTINPDHVYNTTGTEDQWFKLGEETSQSFNLSTDWSNEDSDGSEQTFALLTPELTASDGSQSDANGSKFRYTDGAGNTVTQTFGGDPIEIPMEFLDSLEFLAPPNFAGRFDITVEGLTRDTDPDDGTVDEQVSGSATLSNILIEPSADPVTTAVTAKITADEDDTVPLSIRPNSSDPSETFNVTIDAIPDGAVIRYDGNDYEIGSTGLPDGISVTDNGNGSWSLAIENIDTTAAAGMEMTLPSDSNEPFLLNVSTVSVDTLDIDNDGTPEYTSTSDPFDLSVRVEPEGVADPADATITAPADQSYTEAGVENEGVALSDLINAQLTDTDGSESLSYHVSNLPPGFTLEGGRSIGDGEWAFSDAEIGNVKVIPPENFSGDATFNVATVTTEDDGDSLTEEQDVTLRVTPTPEAEMTLATVADEDTATRLDFAIQHRNGDDDEVIDTVWLNAAEVDAAPLTLTVGNGGDTLATAADQSGSGVVEEDGWYKLDASVLDNIWALGDANWSGNTELTTRYGVRDPFPGDSNLDETAFTDASYQITVEPITDQPSITVDDSGDYTLNDPGTLEIPLTLSNEGQDYDGSETLVRVVIDDVPEGVVVQNADYIGDGQWLQVRDDAFIGERSESITLDVLGYADLQDHRIGITVTTEDDGNGQLEPARTEISLTTDFTASGDGDAPAEILQWEAVDTFDPTEDTAFTLDEAFVGQVQDGVTDNGVNITLSALPDGTMVTGMTETVIDGETVYTASAQGGDAALQSLLAGITVTPPPELNRNNGTFDYDATLTTFLPSGRQEQETVNASQSVEPVSDEPALTISAPAVNEGDDLAISIDLSNPADAPNWALVDGQIYLQVDEGGLPAGTLRDDGGNALSTESVSGVTGVPDGDYYVLDATAGGTLSLTYEPGSATQAGDIGLTAYARGQEAGAGNIETTSTTTETALEPVNNGYDVSVADASGAENAFAQAEADRSNVVELDVNDNGLVDTDGSESLGSVLLKDVPNGFLVFVGDDAASAEQAGLATNAGGSGTNTWLIGDGEIPAYIGIMPPRYWSGTVENLALVVNSGETGLSETTTTEALFDLTIDAVANGVSIKPTPSFGNEGDVIALNLNHELADRKDAGSGDASTESITLEVKGLGEHAGFYVDGSLISGTSQVAYDAGTDTYTVNGLSAEDAENLGFIQAANDVDTVEVRARSEESANGDVSDWTDWTAIETDIESAFGTTGDDTLLWTGGALDGRGGEDTVQLRFDESVTGDEIGNQLANVEMIDMSGSGANNISTLSLEDVLDATDDRNVLVIDGDSEDGITLDTDWTEQTSGAPAGYTLYQGDVGNETVELQVANTVTVE